MSPYEKFGSYETIETYFDERLTDLEIHSDLDRDQIDTFWSAIFFSQLGDSQKWWLDTHVRGKENIQDLQVVPTDYSEDGQDINVIIQSYVVPKQTYKITPGPGVFTKLYINGHLCNESGEISKYPPAMKPHVKQLIAHTALNYEPLRSDMLWS